MQTVQGRCYYLQILCHPSCTFLPPLKARYEKMFMHLFAVKNLCPSLNSRLWAQGHERRWLRLMWDYRCPSPGSQSTHPLHFSLLAFLIRKFLRHLKPFFCSCLLVSNQSARLNFPAVNPDSAPQTIHCFIHLSTKSDLVKHMLQVIRTEQHTKYSSGVHSKAITPNSTQAAGDTSPYLLSAKRAEP